MQSLAKNASGETFSALLKCQKTNINIKNWGLQSVRSYDIINAKISSKV